MLELICGCDEVGRGALAGPMVVAGVILPENFTHPLLRDSKKLSQRQRETIAPIIRRAALTCQEYWVTSLEIDKVGVHKANIMAFEKLLGLIEADVFYVDGNLKLNTLKNYRSIVSGDALYPSIAAASIIAKVARDNHMTELIEQYPNYAWEKNKGYGAAIHIQAMRQFGLSPEHRRSFQLKSLNR